MREFLRILDSLRENVPRHDGLDRHESILPQRLGGDQGGTDLREKAYLLVDRVTTTDSYAAMHPRFSRPWNFPVHR